jgi:hypothetical protein
MSELQGGWGEGDGGRRRVDQLVVHMAEYSNLWMTWRRQPGLEAAGTRWVVRPRSGRKVRRWRELRVGYGEVTA